MASSSVEPVARGGYRGTEAAARYTAQLVWLDTPETKNRIKALASRYRISQARVLRAVAVSGLDALEAGLASGRIRAESLY
jgi:hypothetical protein